MLISCFSSEVRRAGNFPESQVLCNHSKLLLLFAVNIAVHVDVMRQELHPQEANLEIDKQTDGKATCAVFLLCVLTLQSQNPSLKSMSST